MAQNTAAILLAWAARVCARARTSAKVDEVSVPARRGGPRKTARRGYSEAPTGILISRRIAAGGRMPVNRALRHRIAWMLPDTAIGTARFDVFD